MGDASGDSFGNTYLINRQNGLTSSGSILEKFNPTGALIWSQTNSMSASKVENGSDNHPIISGFPSPNTAGAAFMKYDSSGTLLWQNLDADGPITLLNHGPLKLDAANSAYLSGGNLFNMAICKVKADGSNGWVGLVSGSNSVKAYSVFSMSSVYLIGGTTAKLLQDSVIIENITLSEDMIIEATQYIQMSNVTVTGGANLVLIAPVVDNFNNFNIETGSTVLIKDEGCY
jgi:hypothetical protein